MAFVSLARDRDYRLLWAGQVLSDVGAQATALAYPLLVLGLTGSPVAAGGLAGIASAVRVGLRLPSGVIADRFDRRRLMIGCETVRALALASLAVAVLVHHAGLVHIGVVATIDAAAYVVFSTAERAGLRHLVPPERLPAAVAAHDARTQIANLLGPSLGGGLFALGRAAPFLLDAVTYVLSLVTVAAIPGPRLRPVPAETRNAEPWRPALAAGLRFVAAEPFLRVMLVLALMLNLTIGGASFTTILVLHQAGAGAAVIGACQAVIAAAGLLGAALSGRFQRLFAPRRLVLVVCGLVVTAAGACAVLPAGYLSVVPMPVMFLFVPALNAALLGHQARVTPAALHGRVISVTILVATLAGPVAPLAAGLLMRAGGARLAFGVFALTLAITAISARYSSGLTQMQNRHVPPADGTTA